MQVPLKQENVVLLHGWGCDSSTWLPVLTQLHGLGNVIAIDLPGFGESPAIKEFSLDAVVETVVAQLPDTCVLIGWSLGGMLAVQIAARYPQKVSRLITLATNIKFVASKDYPHAMPLVTNRQFNNSFEANPIIALKLFSGLLAQGDVQERALLKKIRSTISTDKVNASWLQALQLLAKFDNRTAYSALTQPGLHLLGEADALVPVEIAPLMAALNETQTITVLAQAAHALHWSQPEKVMQAIQEFFYRVPPASIFLNNNVDLHALPIEKKRVAESFSRAALTYDRVAELQRDIGEKLACMLTATDAEVVVDLGCGTGYFCQHLHQQFPQATIIGIDLAEGMLAVAQQKNPAMNTWLCSDAEHLPLASNSVDVIFSSLALQWCHNLHELFSELNRVLKPSGKVVFSTLGPDTLHEMKAAWQEVDDYVHVNRFKSESSLRNSLVENNFSIERFDKHLPVVEFEKLTDLTRGLKALGAHNVNHGRAAGLTGRKKMAALKTAYEKFRCGNMLPATYDVFYCVAEKMSRS